MKRNIALIIASIAFGMQTIQASTAYNQQTDLFILNKTNKMIEIDLPDKNSATAQALNRGVQNAIVWASVKPGESVTINESYTVKRDNADQVLFVVTGSKKVTKVTHSELEDKNNPYSQYKTNLNNAANKTYK